MTRRSLLLAAAAAAARGATISRFRLAVCSDVFPGKSFAQCCELAREAGYSGVEATPGMLAPDVTAMTALERRVVRNSLVDNGLQLAGLRNLLATPPGWHATTNEAMRRRRTWDYIRRLIDWSADVGDSPFLILDSGRQRATVPDMTVAEATVRLRDGLNELAVAAAIRGVTIVLEPLPRSATNVVNTVDQAAALVRRINNPSVRTMVNTRCAAEETLPPANLIRAFAPLIKYVHVSEPESDSRPILQALFETGYTGWISAEVSANPAETASSLRRIEASLR
jgi:sugar phosphate isomerase/epimerase